MIPALLGNAIQRKRIALGLTQQQLADMAGLSRQSLNGIEHGSVNATLQTMGRLMDVLGLAVDIQDPEESRRMRGAPTRALWMAAKGANVSYTGELTPTELERALATGEVPSEYRPQVAQVLDEAPLQLVTKVVAEVAAKQHRNPADIWKNLRRLAQSLMVSRGGLWA
ncbi:helix-turn-helix transcriptional regulator [Cupriavidus alkaliphilus]|uniref:Transcriptional regulator with XRE-family HTH domain n=1 Tax=Cupriavidus alkaliphilus TaxID=942866 RepID=A0A7W4VEB3_9BURK|nr:helix-turn-helix transcriptional regulator [Cupriavidus alkaliphilus]MBB3010026.1 transcriptional regulator with XRE-family HTH domain [Cupriavidus alkaliphilus]